MIVDTPCIVIYTDSSTQTLRVHLQQFRRPIRGHDGEGSGLSKNADNLHNLLKLTRVL